MEILEGAADARHSSARTSSHSRCVAAMEGSGCAVGLLPRHEVKTHKLSGYRGVPPTPRSGCSCLVIDDDCIIFGGTLMVQQQQQQQQQLDGIGSPAATMNGLSRVYFNDLVYFRFSAGSAGSTTGVWVHQPKRSGELWPSARSGHAAAAGTCRYRATRLLLCLTRVLQLGAVCSSSAAGLKAAAVDE
jgi:hypothetical protein